MRHPAHRGNQFRVSCFEFREMILKLETGNFETDLPHQQDLRHFRFTRLVVTQSIQLSNIVLTGLRQLPPERLSFSCDLLKVRHQLS